MADEDNGDDPPTQAMPPAGDAEPTGQVPNAAAPGGTGWVLAGRYRVLDRIGSGGMAEVFRAHDDLLNRDVAIKVFKSGVDETGDTAGVARQALELQSLARLNHPNLITLYDGSMSNVGPSFLVMELVEGTDLAVRLQSGALPAEEVREIGAQIASALAYVQAQGLAHRDVKPANILLGADGDHTSGSGVRARLSDFGIVRLLDSPRMTSADLTVGTASYLSPEQARGGDVGPPADVYSLGLVLIETLTGHRSFDGPMLEAMAARLSRPPHIPAELPPPWPQLLTAMTALDPAARPSATQVAQALRGSAPPPVLPPLGPAAAAATTTYLPAAPAAYSASGTTALPARAALPPPVVPVRPLPREPERSPSPWRAALLTLAGLVVLGIVGLVIYLLSSGTSDNPGGGSSSSSSAPSRSAPKSASSSSRHSSSARSHASSAPSSRTSSSQPTRPPSSSTRTSTSSHSTSSAPSTSSSAKTSTSRSSSSAAAAEPPPTTTSSSSAP